MGQAAHPLLMKHLSRWPLSRGSYTSTTSTNFSSMCPSSASPAQEVSRLNGADHQICVMCSTASFTSRHHPQLSPQDDSASKDMAG